MTSKASLEEKASAEVAAASSVEPIGGSADEAMAGDGEFGGPEELKRIERKLLWKLDCRMAVMIVIYILNYVRSITLYFVLCSIL